MYVCVCVCVRARARVFLCERTIRSFLLAQNQSQEMIRTVEGDSPMTRIMDLPKGYINQGLSR